MSTNFPGFVCFLEQIKNQIEIIVLIETHLLNDHQIFGLDCYVSSYNEGFYIRCDIIMVNGNYTCKYIPEGKGVELVIGEQPEKILIRGKHKSPQL